MITISGWLGATDKIVKLRGRSQQVLPYLAGESFDFVYVDGSHLVLDVLQDAAMCWPLIRPGGTLVFDDYEHPLFPIPLACRPGHRCVPLHALRQV